MDWEVVDSSPCELEDTAVEDTGVDDTDAEDTDDDTGLEPPVSGPSCSAVPLAFGWAALWVVPVLVRRRT